MIKTYKKFSLKELIKGNNPFITITSNSYNKYSVVTSQLTDELIKRATEIAKVDLNTLYNKLTIPKRKGGFRHIVDPNPELKTLQKDIANYFQNLGLHPHQNAYAYVKNKDTTLNAKQHQNAKIIIALDIKDFFNSITLDNLVDRMQQFINIDLSKESLKTLLNICCLNNELPQGSPASPYLSNLYMIIFDKKISTFCERLGYTYTRYADDMFISGQDIPHPNRLINTIQEYLDKTSNNTLKLNRDKTKILRPGRCYITGVKINKDNKLSYGHEKKTELKHMIYNLFISKQNNTCCKEQVQEVLGLYSYARRIEPEYFNYLEQKYLKMFGSNAKSFAKHFKEYL